MPAKITHYSYTRKVSQRPGKCHPNSAQRKANGPWLTLLCFIYTPFATSTRQAPMKPYRNSTTSGSNQHPSLLRGMQLTCGLQDFMMSLHHQTDKQLDGWLGPQRSPSIDRSIEYAWASHFTLQVLLGLQRTSKSYFATRHTSYMLAGFDKTFSHCKLNRYVRSSVDCFSSRNGIQWNGLSHNPPSISQQM